jgi:glycosyltransferase involved in cell wall biosynthesis
LAARDCRRWVGAGNAGLSSGVDDARVQILWLAHCGNPGRVRNAALAVATGRYVAFLDSDDVCLRLAMRSAVAALDEPLCGVRAHDHHYSDSDRAAAFADWMRLYEKFASLAPTASLRAECPRLRARSAGFSS